MSELTEAEQDRLYQLAEQAVGPIALEGRPNLAPDWPSITPADIGLSIDDWLKMSSRMTDVFNKTAGKTINLPRASLSSYRTKKLVLFVMRLHTEALLQ